MTAFAQLIALALLVGIGAVLFLISPLFGGAYFVLLLIVALLRVLLR